MESIGLRKRISVIAGSSIEHPASEEATQFLMSECNLAAAAQRFEGISVCCFHLAVKAEISLSLRFKMPIEEGTYGDERGHFVGG